MNRFSYYITTHFITSNKYYNSYRNPNSVYQTYPNYMVSRVNSLANASLLLCLYSDCKIIIIITILSKKARCDLRVI